MTTSTKSVGPVAATPGRSMLGLTGLLLIAMAITMVVAMETGRMSPAGVPILAAAGAAAGAACIAFALGCRDGVNVALIALILCSITYATASVSAAEAPGVELTTQGYSEVARILRQRPDAEPLLADARADGVVTNAEKKRFEADLTELDRRRALGIR